MVYLADISCRIDPRLYHVTLFCWEYNTWKRHETSPLSLSTIFTFVCTSGNTLKTFLATSAKVLVVWSQAKARKSHQILVNNAVKARASKGPCDLAKSLRRHSPAGLRSPRAVKPWNILDWAKEVEARVMLQRYFCDLLGSTASYHELQS